MSDYINFVLTGDKNYVIPLGVLMTSILVNTSKKFTPRFFLFTDGFSDGDIKRINEVKKIRSCEIINMPITQYLHYFNEIDVSTSKLQYVSLATYYRLLMFEILPEDVDKCFYVDGDMIVGGDLSRIYRKFPNNKLVAIAMEIWAMTHKEIILTHLKNISDFTPFTENPYKAPYFNAGFFLVNIKQAKKLKIFEQCLDFLKRYPNPWYVDQDVLNAVLGQKYRNNLILLDPSYNVFCDIPYNDKLDTHIYSLKQIQKALKHPVIYHYAGSNKPWLNDKAAHHYQVWWHYCRLSPFSKLPEPRKPEPVLNKKYKLFDILLVLRQKRTPRYNNFYLFGTLPIWFVRYKGEHQTSHYLFGIIPILKIKKKKT